MELDTMNESEFINYMRADIFGEYGEHIISLWQTLTEDERKECLGEGRPKHICSAVESVCMRKELPDFFTLDPETATKVMRECPLTFTAMYLDVWSNCPMKAKRMILRDAEKGWPFPAKDVKDRWLSLSGILYSIMVGD